MILIPLNSIIKALDKLQIILLYVFKCLAELIGYLKDCRNAGYMILDLSRTVF
jgi:hypothetical protein